MRKNWSILYILYTKNSLKIPFLEQQFFKNYLPDLQLLNRNYSSRTFQRWHLVESFRDEEKKKGKKKRSRATCLVIVSPGWPWTRTRHREAESREGWTPLLVISRSVDRESIDRWTNAVLSHSREPAFRQQPLPPEAGRKSGGLDVQTERGRTGRVMDFASPRENQCETGGEKAKVKGIERMDRSLR